MGAAFVQLSLTPILIGIMAAIACALPGNFLLLKKQALIGDAISHVILPGVIGAFLLTGFVATWPMLIGATVAAVVAVLLIEAIKRAGAVEPGAAMGVVFTAMFAGGVLLLEQANLGDIHLDVEHALYGNLESVIWFAAEDWGSLLNRAALAELPPELLRVAAVACVISLLTWVFWRPLSIATFDEGFASAIGLPTAWISLGVVITSAVAAVAAFDAVGSIIVIAMFICPAAAARLMTDRLDRQIWWSVLFAATAALSGYIFAGYGPIWLGFSNAVSSAGMIATMSGLFLTTAAIWGPCRK